MLRPGEGTTPAGTWGDWLAPAAAWERVLAAWQPDVLGQDDVPLTESRGRVLAADVRAPFDSPPFDRSAMDGYALRAQDTTTASDDAPARLAFAGDVPMGVAGDVQVGPGQAAWVATGSMLPPGADSVVMVERTAREGDTVLVRQATAPGDNLVRRGDDVRAGDVVLRAGRVLRPQDVAVLASLGLARVPVRRRPRVAIISGGDELVAPGEPLAPGQIFDSNSYAMAAQIAQWGGEPLLLARVPDRPAAVRAALERAVGEAHIALLSGGSSVGIKDLTAEAIDAVARERQPAQGPQQAESARPSYGSHLQDPAESATQSAGVLVHGVAMRPARPTIIGVIEGVLVIGIPGNPVSAMIACEAFARPAIETLLGLQPVRQAGTVGDYTVQGRLAARVRSQAGRQDYVRVRLEEGDAGIAVHPVPGGSNAIRSMVDADGLLVVPPERETLEEGETVEVSLF